MKATSHANQQSFHPTASPLANISCADFPVSLIPDNKRTFGPRIAAAKGFRNCVAATVEKDFYGFSKRKQNLSSPSPNNQRNL